MSSAASWLQIYWVRFRSTTRHYADEIGAILPSSESFFGLQDVAGVVSDLIVSGGNKVRLRIDWRVASILRGRSYMVWVKAAIGSQFKEGFARFNTFGL